MWESQCSRKALMSLQIFNKLQLTIHSIQSIIHRELKLGRCSNSNGNKLNNEWMNVKRYQRINEDIQWLREKCLFIGKTQIYLCSIIDQKIKVRNLKN